MGSESLPDPPESSQFTGTKRLGALLSVGRETKRLCTLPSRLPPGSAALELSNGHDWCGGFGIASNPGFDSAVSQCGIGPGTKRGNTVPPGVFGLGSTPIHPAAGSDPLLFNQIPVEMGEMNMQSNPGAERLYHQPEYQESTSTFDLQYSFDASKAINPSLELSYGFDFSYSGNFSESSMLPDPNYSSFTTFMDCVSTTVDGTTGSEWGSGYQPVGFSSYESDTIEIVPKSEGILVTSLEPKPVENEDNSEYSSAVISHNNCLLGMPTINLPVLSQIF
jgi:hypothetical protein